MDEDEDGVCSTHVVSWLWLLLCVYVMSMMKRLEQANWIVVVFTSLDSLRKMRMVLVYVIWL